MMIDLESNIIIKELGAWMDGGSVTLYCINELNQEFQIHFVQKVIWEIPKDFRLPGRIYLNDKLIKQRSEQEELIIKKIEKSNLKNLDKLDRQILKEDIDYVKSEQYLLDVKKVKFEERE